MQTTDALVAGFEQATGITVEVRSDDEDTLADQIVTEGNRSPADVIYPENSPALEYLQDKGLLARVSVIIDNPSLISKCALPTSVLQLADRRYAGELALAPGETDFQSIVTSVDRADGRAAALRWLEGVKANAGSHLHPDNEAIADEVNRGAVAFGVVNQYSWYRMRAEIGAAAMHSDISSFAPHDPGYVVDVSGAAVLRSSTHQAAAQRFLAYLPSPPAQEIIGSPSKSISFEYPIGSGVTTSAPETPFHQLQPYPVTVSELGTGATAIALPRASGLL